MIFSAVSVFGVELELFSSHSGFGLAIKAVRPLVGKVRNHTSPCCTATYIQAAGVIPRLGFNIITLD